MMISNAALLLCWQPVCSLQSGTTLVLWTDSGAVGCLVLVIKAGGQHLARSTAPRQLTSGSVPPGSAGFAAERERCVQICPDRTFPKPRTVFTRSA